MGRRPRRLANLPRRPNAAAGLRRAGLHATPGPGGDLARYVERGVGSAMWRHRARVTVHAPAGEIIARVPPAVIVEAIDEHTCFATVGSGSAHTLAQWLGLLDVDFDAGHDPELAHELRRLAERLTRATG